MENHDHNTEQALKEAEALCRERGERFTELRRQVLKLVLETDGPVKAYDLIDGLSTERQRVAPPTVYRSLEFLLEQGLLHRIESLNAFVACCGDAAHRHAVQFFICNDCGSVAELSDDRIADAISKRADEMNFADRRQTIEVTGRCGDCRKAS